MAGSDDPARQFLHLWVNPRHFLGISQVEYGGALLLALVPFVERAEQAIPKEVGDPVIAFFVMEMVSHVPRLHRRQKFALRLVGQMLDAVAEFIKAGREKTRRQGNSRPAQAAQGIAARRGRERDGGQDRTSVGVGKECVSTGRSRWWP